MKVILMVRKYKIIQIINAKVIAEIEAESPKQAVKQYCNSNKTKIRSIEKVDNVDKANMLITFDYEHNNYYNICFYTKKEQQIQIKERKEDKEYQSRLIRNEIIKSGKDLLCHGSDGGIKGSIVCKNENQCDFGNGFYTGTHLLQAENRVSNKKEAYVYAFEYNLINCNVYKFEDGIAWALVVGFFRKKIDATPYKKLLQLIDIVNNSDVVIGFIADDKISEAFNDFLAGNITDVCMVESLKLIKYGNQYVFKNEEIANKRLKVFRVYELTSDMKNKSKVWGTKLKENMDANVESLKRKYRRSGRYIDECLEEYR